MDELNHDPWNMTEEKKKLSTAEILAQLRQKKAEGAAAEQPAPAAEAPAVEAAAASPPAEAAPPPAPAGDKPKSTADILAAARAQKAAAAPAGDAPKSTADILAAARGQGGGAKPAAPKSTADILAAARAAKAAAAVPAGGGEAVEKPAAKKSVVAKPAAAAPVVAGDKPALKDMVAAVKAAQEGKPIVAARPAGAPPAPKLPGKPAAAKADASMTRRSAFVTLLVLLVTPFYVAWTAMAALGGLWSLGIARFMMPNMVLELPSKFQVGPPSDYPPGAVSEKYKASRGVWLVRSTNYNGQDIVYALASVCTHLGCTPNWLEGEQKFKCPCHGSGFYISGINFEGPAPRPLERVGLRRAENGMLEVDKSLKFQEELGQWGDGKSYVEIG